MSPSKTSIAKGACLELDNLIGAGFRSSSSVALVDKLEETRFELKNDPSEEILEF